MKQNYSKIKGDARDFIREMQARGLVFDDPDSAVSYVRNIGHFRLLSYMYPFICEPKSKGVFKKGTNFHQVLRVYGFDKKLRLLLFNEIEKIEVAFRNIVSDRMVEMTGDDSWMLNENYVSRETMNLIKKEFHRTNDDFLSGFSKIHSEKYPPTWVMIEVLTFGTMTWIFRNLPFRYKKDIARYFHLNAPVMDSWMNVIVLTRNACCHHARLWNRVFSLITLTMNGMTRPWIDEDVDRRRTFHNISMVKYFLDIISPANDFKEKLMTLLKLYPEIDISAMGFPRNWQHSIWQ